MPNLTIKDAKDAAAEWIARNSGSLPGFAGAFITGSTNWKPDDAPYSLTSDIDIIVVYEGTQAPVTPGRFMYRGVLRPD